MQVFFKRLFSTLVLWGVILGGLFAGGKYVSILTFWLVVGGLSYAAFQEFVKMQRVQGFTFAKNSLGRLGFLFLSVELILGVSQRSLDSELSMLPLGAAGIWMAYLLFHYRYSNPRLAPLAVLVFGWFYIFCLAGFLVRIFTFDNSRGAWLLILFIVLTKFSDLGAYVTGSLIGRHKMIPKVSPGKTWEGFFGAILFSALCGFLLVKVFPDPFHRIPPFHVLILGAVLGATAVLGDLVESLLKREADVKDSGQFIPGIGGALDLVDSLLFNAPIMYAYLCFFYRQ